MRSAANAYARASHSALSPREAESAVLIKAAQQLQAVRDDWANQAPSLNKALSFNQKVWTIIAGAAAEPDSPLPIEIKRGVTDLSVFVFRRMVDTMVEPSAEKLAALISINQNLAAGLSAR